MTILDRYVAKEFIRLFFFILALLTSLFLIVEFFERIRMFLSNNASLFPMISYFFFSVPLMISQTIPFAVLLAALMTFSTLSKNSEIVAMKANGVSLYRTSLPVVLICIVISVFTFFLNEFITPLTNQKADDIIYIKVQKRDHLGTFKQNQLWYRGINGIYNIKMFDPKMNILQGITINYLDKNFVLEKRIDAERAEWQNDHWVFYNILITQFTSGDFPTLEWASSKVIELPEKPADFNVVQKDTEKMGFLELRKYVRKIQSEGYDATKYLVDMYGKIAFTFVNIILVIIGISFSLMKTERSGGVMQSIGIGIIIGFSYWIIHAFSLSLGRSGTIPPLVSAWFANFVFGIVSVLMFTRVKT